MSKKRNSKKREGTRIYRICYALFSKIVKVLFRIKVVGAEKEPDESGFIVCSNHIAASDVVAICYAFKKRQIRYMAKKELFSIPLLSSLIKMLGAFPVDRSGKDVGAIKTSISILESGGSMGLFPQGHRYPGVDPRTTKVKNGAALISTKASADIVPVYIHKKNNTSKLFRRTYVVIGDKIPFESFGYDPEASGEYARISNIVFDRICTMGEEFREKLEADKKKKGKK